VTLRQRVDLEELWVDLEVHWQTCELTFREACKWPWDRGIILRNLDLILTNLRLTPETLTWPSERLESDLETESWPWRTLTWPWAGVTWPSGGRKSAAMTSLTSMWRTLLLAGDVTWVRREFNRRWLDVDFRSAPTPTSSVNPLQRRHSSTSGIAPTMTKRYAPPQSYLDPLSPVYKIQPVVKRLSNRFHNRLNVCIHDTTGCQTGLTTGLTTGWMFVYTMKPVVKPVIQPDWQPVV